MKKVFQIVTILCVLSSSISAQWTVDSVSMAPGYSNSVFYALGNGIQQTSPSANWHLAFSLNILDSASVFANHFQGQAALVKVFNIHKPISAWTSVSINDTTGADTLYSGNNGWYEGAFNQIPSANIFNFGWGTYDLATHVIRGDSMFLLQSGPKFYKFAIDSLDAIPYVWHIRVEEISATATVQSYTINKSNFTNRLFAYFNLDSGLALDREPAISSWDFQFLNYPQYLQAGPQSAWRGVTGALVNRGTAVAKAAMVHVDTAMNNYTQMVGGASAPTWWPANWEKAPYTTIGYDWKNFDYINNVYILPDSLSYFISAKNDTVYQLQFLSFGGGANGDIKFQYRPMGSSPLQVSDLNNLGALSLYPNPAASSTHIMFNAKQNSVANLSITGLNGQRVYQQPYNVQPGLNVMAVDIHNLPAGTYIVQLQDKVSAVSYKLTVTR